MKRSRHYIRNVPIARVPAVRHHARVSAHDSSQVVDRLRVGAKSGGWNGPGWLTIRNGLLEFAPSRVGPLTWSGPASHSRAEVIVVETTLAPPWMNTSVLLNDPFASATVPVWQRRRLLTSLSRAGFSVNRKRTWFSLGSRRLAP